MSEDGLLPFSSNAEFEIRKASASDLDALARLEAIAFTSDRLSRRRLGALVKSPSARMIVACHGAALLGYALVLTRRGGRAARLYSIAVAPDESGRGVGSRLLAAAEAVALTAGAKSLRLEVRADNPAAVGFYERRGYSSIGRRAGYYEDGMTALLLERELIVPSRKSASAPRFGRAA